MSLNDAKKVTYEDYVEIEIICPYSDYGKINILLQQYDVIIDDSDFADEIKIKFAVREDISKELLDKIVDTFNGRIIPKCVGIRIDCK
jgi:putative IMPACT (imprinted ancient) family translation regulator